MATPIYVRTKELMISDAKRASSCIEDAVSGMSKVDKAVSGWDLYIDAAADGFVFANSESEIGVCLAALRTKQVQLDKLISVMQVGTEKLEEADATFKNDITDPSLWERLTDAAARAIYMGTIGKGNTLLVNSIWLYNLFSGRNTNNKEQTVIEDESKQPSVLPTPQVQINENYDFPTNRAQRATPKKTNSEDVRSAKAYLEVVDSFDVENTSRYQEYDGNTYCNIYVWDVTAAMGCEIPHWVNASGEPAEVGASGAYELSAAGARDWLANHGEKYGWYECSKEEAIAMANSGYPTVTCDTAGDHIAMVVPQLEGESGIQISQAGWKNLNHASVNWGWGNSYTLKYYYHK